MNTSKDKLSRYMDAGFPILMYNTYDEPNAVNILVNLDDNRTVIQWSEIGMVVNESDANDITLDSMLQFLVSTGGEDLNSSILILKDIRHHISNPKVIGLLKYIAQLITTGGVEECTLVLLGENIELPVELEPFVTIIDEDAVKPNEIALCIEQFCNEQDIPVDNMLKGKLVNAFRGLSKYEIENILALSYADDGEITSNDLELVLEQKKQIVKKSGVLEMIALDETMNDIGGLEVLKEWIQNKAKIYKDIDAAKAFGVDMPKGVLIAGIPGCGKSLSAKATAKLFNTPLLRLDMGRIMGKYVGESEQNMRKAIKIAEDISPCVLWIDEIEKAFSGVSGGSSTGDITNRLLGSFLTWLQEKKSQVFVIMTANDVNKLPAELIRKGRLDEVFFVEFPNNKEREQIFKIHLEKRRPTDLSNIDLDRIVSKTDGYSGADIEGVVKDAIELAFTSERNVVTTEDIIKSIDNTHSLKVIMSKSIDDMIKMYKEKKFKNASK